MTVEWADPVGEIPRRDERRRWWRFQQELQSRPGSWAVARRDQRKDLALTTASYLRRYYRLQTEVRTLNGEWIVFARYLEEVQP